MSEDFPADHLTWTCPDATLQNFAVSSIVIGSFTLHIEPDGSLRGSGNADGAAQSFLDNVVASHNAKLHELRALVADFKAYLGSDAGPTEANQLLSRAEEALAIAQKPA